MGRIPEWFVAVLTLVSAAPIALWTTGAIYFDLGHGGAWGRRLAAGWAVGVVVLFAVWRPLWQPFAVLVGLFAAFLGWWLRLKPSHHRDWDLSVAVMPRAVCDGDAVTIENVRNFDDR